MPEAQNTAADNLNTLPPPASIVDEAGFSRSDILNGIAGLGGKSQGHSPSEIREEKAIQFGQQAPVTS